MAEDKKLSLGTIFTGEVDKAFESAVARLDSILNRLRTSMNDINKGTKKATETIKGYTSATKEAAQASTGLAKQSTQVGKQIAGVRGAVERLKAAMKVTVSYGIAAAAIYTVVDALKSGAREMIEYDQALRNLQAISGATDAQVSVMGDTIKDVARITKFSTVEVAEGMVLLTQAGFTASEAMAAIKSLSMLATGTLSSFQVTADLVTSTLRAFGLEAMEATRVADVMANAINKSKLTIDKLRTSFNYIGAAAAQTGLSLEETAASMMSLANNGLRASTIGTGMRQVLARMVAPTRKLREAFEDYGIDLDKINPRLVGFTAAMRNLAPVLWDTKKGTVDMTKAFQLFGLRGAQSVAVLVKAFQGSEFDEMISKVYEVGAAEAMAGIQAEGLQLKIKNLSDRFLLFAVAVGEAGIGRALGAIVDLLKYVATGMEWIAKQVLPSLLIGWGAWTLAIAATAKSAQILYLLLKQYIGMGIIAWVSQLVQQFKFLNYWITASGVRLASLRAAFSALWFMMSKNPFMWVITGLALIATGTLALIRQSKKLRDDLEKNVEVQTAAVKSIQQYATALEDLQKRMSEGEDVSDQYQATVFRILKDHEELAGKVDANTVSYTDLKAAMSALELEKFDEAAQSQIQFLISQKKHINNLKGAYSQLSADISGVTEIFTAYEEISTEAFEKTKEGALALAKYNRVEQELIYSMVKLVDTEKITMDQAEERLFQLAKSIGLTDELARALTDKLKPAYEALQNIKVAFEIPDVTGITEEYKVLYDKLTEVQKVALIEQTKQMRTQTKNAEKDLRVALESQHRQMVARAGKDEALLKKAADFKLDIEKKVGILIQRMRLETLLKFLDNIGAEKLSMLGLLNFKRSILTQMAKLDDEYQDKAVEAENKRYENEKAKILDTFNRKSEAEGVSQAKRESLEKETSAKLEIARKQHLENIKNLEARYAGSILASKDAFTSGVTTKKKGKSSAELLAESDKKYWSILHSARQDALQKIEADYQKQLIVDQEWLAKRIELAKGSAKKIAEANEMYDKLREAHQIQSVTKSLEVVKSEEEGKLNLIREGAIQELEVRKQAAVGNKSQLSILAQEERQIRLDHLKKMLDLEEVHLEDLKRMLPAGHDDIIAQERKLGAERTKVAQEVTGDLTATEAERIDSLKRYFDEGLQQTQLYSDKWLWIMKFMHKEGMLETAQFLSQMKAYHVYWMDEAEKQWKRGEIAVDLYTKKIKEAFDAAAITVEEKNQRMIASTGTWTEALEWGFDRAREKIQSWQELFMEIGQNFTDQFAGGVTSALWDFIDGTKSAEQAFQDFARSMLRWISEMIIKLLIQKAIMMAMGALGGTGSTDLGSGTGWSGPSTVYAHKGGIVGETAFPSRIVNPNVFTNAKKFAGGGMIGASEVPIIAHKGEGVFTPEQMAAMGGGGTTVELTNINVTDSRVLAMLMASPTGKSAMFNFIGTNAPMIKRMLGGR